MDHHYTAGVVMLSSQCALLSFMAECGSLTHCFLKLTLGTLSAEKQNNPKMLFTFAVAQIPFASATLQFKLCRHNDRSQDYFLGKWCNIYCRDNRETVYNYEKIQLLEELYNTPPLAFKIYILRFLFL